MRYRAQHHTHWESIELDQASQRATEKAEIKLIRVCGGDPAVGDWHRVDKQRLSYRVYNQAPVVSDCLFSQRGVYVCRASRKVETCV